MACAPSGEGPPDRSLTYDRLWDERSPMNLTGLRHLDHPEHVRATYNIENHTAEPVGVLLGPTRDAARVTWNGEVVGEVGQWGDGASIEVVRIPGNAFRNGRAELVVDLVYSGYRNPIGQGGIGRARMGHYERMVTEAEEVRASVTANEQRSLLPFLPWVLVGLLAALRARDPDVRWLAGSGLLMTGGLLTPMTDLGWLPVLPAIDLVGRLAISAGLALAAVFVARFCGTANRATQLVLPGFLVLSYPLTRVLYELANHNFRVAGSANAVVTLVFAGALMAQLYTARQTAGAAAAGVGLVPLALVYAMLLAVQWVSIQLPAPLWVLLTVAWGAVPLGFGLALLARGRGSP